MGSAIGVLMLFAILAAVVIVENLKAEQEDRDK
jgi:hypothetical protein